MLSLEDCLDFSDLASEEVEAIARHEHVPLVVAAEMGCELLKSDAGVHCIETMIIECAQDAVTHGHPDVAAGLVATYERFHATHPTAC